MLPQLYIKPTIIPLLNHTIDIGTNKDYLKHPISDIFRISLVYLGALLWHLGE